MLVGLAAMVAAGCSGSPGSGATSPSPTLGQVIGTTVGGCQIVNMSQSGLTVHVVDPTCFDMTFLAHACTLQPDQLSQDLGFPASDKRLTVDRFHTRTGGEAYVQLDTTTGARITYACPNVAGAHDVDPSVMNAFREPATDDIRALWQDPSRWQRSFTPGAAAPTPTPAPLATVTSGPSPDAADPTPAATAQDAATRFVTLMAAGSTLPASKVASPDAMGIYSSQVPAGEQYTLTSCSPSVPSTSTVTCTLTGQVSTATLVVLKQDASTPTWVVSQMSVSVDLGE